MDHVNRTGRSGAWMRNIAIKRCSHLLMLSGASIAVLSSGVASAQSNEAGSANSVAQPEILVTARKRQESILEVPVVVTAVSEKQLSNLGLTQVTDLPKLVPGLVIGGNLLSIGPQVTIRGVGTSSYDPGVDQSISLNIDGLSLGQGLAFGSGMFDVAQVEVLKGPQALFYGKSSPGGAISLRTADPGSSPEMLLRAGYDFEARQIRTEGVVSGPVTSTLGLRVAGMYTNGEGYFHNTAVAAPGTGALDPSHYRETQPNGYVLRGTAIWRPTSEFSARLKINRAYDRAIDAELSQLSSCPDGAGQAFGIPALGIPPIPFIGNDDCKFDRDLKVVYMDPQYFPGISNGGVPYLSTEQNFATLELNYDITSELSLTSTTAYYDLTSSSLVNTTHTTQAGPVLAVTNAFSRRQFTEEFRLNSDFSGPLNFTLGGFYEDGRIKDRVAFIQNRAYTFGQSPLGFLMPGTIDQDRESTVDIKTYSLFGQLRYKVLEDLELAGGVRWSDETRTLSVFDFRSGTDITPTLAENRVHASNFAPEATINYTPTDDITIFASYKKAYKSGSFSIATPAGPGQDKSFGDEEVQGYEIGLKTRLLDRSLMMNFAFYDYYYQGLQVGGIEAVINGLPSIRTINAGKARTYGVDFDLSWRPQSLDGLSVNASVNWNKGRYTELDNVPCYTGQTVAQGCTTFFIPSANQIAPGPAGAYLDPATGQYGFFTGQDLSGTPMIRAPEWTANFGFDYETRLGSGLKLRLTNNNQYQSKFVTFLAVGRPNQDNYQKDFFKTDASIALGADDERWEIALIGKNITDKLTYSNAAATNFAGANALGGAITGGTTSGPAGYAEVGAYNDAPRSVWLRFTYHYH